MSTTATRDAGLTSDRDMESKDLLLHADDLVAGYLPGVNILNGCSLKVAKGELVGIIGPNGAGKSTLLKALFGLVKIHSGTVTLEGREITGMKANKLVANGVGYVPQNNNVFPSLTVAENMRMGTYLKPKTFADRWEFIGDLFPVLHDRSGQKAGAMSGGERQMVAMGRALMLDPKLLMLDEPSAGLAPLLVDLIFEKVAEINRTGVAVLMVEQNAKRSLELAHRGYVLATGRNQVEGPGAQLLGDPEVARLYLGG